MQGNWYALILLFMMLLLGKNKQGIKLNNMVQKYLITFIILVVVVLIF